MRGEVLHYDDELGVGFINGQDGQRYGFERSDLRRLTPLSKGTRVEFREDNGRAREIFIVQNERAASAVPSIAPGAYPQPQAQQFGRLATPAEPRSTGLLGYFLGAVTANYVNFRDRARRKEYWGYLLFWWIVAVLVGLGGMALDAALGNLDGSQDIPIVTGIVMGLYVLATILPTIAISVRRQHDIGLSGWFYLLIFVPYVGSLIIFVFSLIPSQKHDNKWGPVPFGVRV